MYILIEREKKNTVMKVEWKILIIKGIKHNLCMR